MTLRHIMIGLLSVWCAIGAVSTAGALTGPTVWWNREYDVEGVVGMPLRGAAETVAIRALLPQTDATRWLVRFPPESDELVLMYVRYQLGHLEYPRRVDVGSSEALPNSDVYDGVITAPGLGLPPPWRPTRVQNGFVLYIKGPV